MIPVIAFSCSLTPHYSWTQRVQGHQPRRCRCIVRVGCPSVFMNSESWSLYGHVYLGEVPENGDGDSAVKGSVKNRQMYSEIK